MANENESALMAEFANNLWDNFISKKVTDMLTDSVSYYRAKVTENKYLTDGTLKIKKPFEDERYVKCSKGLKDVAVNSQVTVLKFGFGNNKNEVAFSNGKGTDFIGDTEAMIYQNILDFVYPIGSLYISYSNNANPSTLFTGTTWTQIEGQFLLSASTDHAAGTTGGSETVTLDWTNMPAHTHTVDSVSTESYGTATGTDNELKAGDTQTTSSVGGDAQGNAVAHDNMPPYLTVYMWRRVS